MLLSQTRSLMRAAWRLPPADEGLARMRKLPEMILRWVGGAFLLTEKNFRKIMGYQDL